MRGQKRKQSPERQEDKEKKNERGRTMARGGRSARGKETDSSEEYPPTPQPVQGRKRLNVALFRPTVIPGKGVRNLPKPSTSTQRHEIRSSSTVKDQTKEKNTNTPQEKGRQSYLEKQLSQQREQFKAKRKDTKSDESDYNPFLSSEDDYSPSSEESDNVDQFAETQRPQASQTVKRKTSKKRKREPKKCCDCGKMVINVSRHLRDVHSIRHKKNEDLVKTKQGYIVRQCPYKKCNAIVDRITDHLVRTHHIPKQSLQLKRLRKQATPIGGADSHKRKRQSVTKVKKIKTEIIVISSEDETNKNPTRKCTYSNTTTVIKKERVDSSDEEVGMDCFGGYISDTYTSSINENTLRKRRIQNDNEVITGMNIEEQVEGNEEEVLNCFGGYISDTYTSSINENTLKKRRRQNDNKKKTGMNFKERVESSEEEELDNFGGNISDTYSAPLKEGQSVKPKRRTEYEEANNSDSDSESQEETSESDCATDEDDDDDDWFKDNHEEQFYDNREIKQFVKALQMPPEMKPRNSALQHGFQAHLVWGAVSKTRKLKELFDVDKVNVWLQNFLQDRKPGTARSYLSSIVLFVAHLVRWGLQGVGQALRFKEDIKLLSKSLRKKVNRRKTEKSVEDIENMITPEEITEFFESPVCLKAEETLAKPVEFEVQETDFYTVRDYLLLSLIQANAQRPGAVRNITPRAIECGYEDEEGGGIVVSVADHKTGDKGPANIGVTNAMISKISKYLMMIHQIINRPLQPNHSIFITYPREDEFTKMTSNHVGKACQRLWAKGPSNKHFSATNIRKSTVTHVRLVDPNARLMLANHMSHSPSTADRYYDIIDQRTNAIKVTNLIGSVMNPPLKKANITELDTQTEVTLNTDKKSMERRPEGLITAEESEVHDDDNGMEDESDIGTAIEDYREVSQDMNNEDISVENISATGGHGRRSFARAEVDTLLSICEENIQNSAFTQREILKSMTEHENGPAFLDAMKKKFGEKYIKKIVDRVRTENRQRKKNSN